MKIVLFSIPALIMSCILPVASEQRPSNRASASAAEACPDTHAWTGKYENFSYRFSIVIPDGYKGFWNSARCMSDGENCTCMSDHGRIIPLSAEPYEEERHVEVFASHGAELDEPTVAQGVKQHLQGIRQRSRKQSMTVRSQVKTSVSGWPGRRVIVHYYDKKIKGWFVEDFVEMLKDGDEFTVYLRTPQKDYEKDKEIFERILASFRFQNPEEKANQN
jgi:hypothetical protein